MEKSWKKNYIGWIQPTQENGYKVSFQKSARLAALVLEQFRVGSRPGCLQNCFLQYEVLLVSSNSQEGKGQESVQASQLPLWHRDRWGKGVPAYALSAALSLFWFTKLLILKLRIGITQFTNKRLDTHHQCSLYVTKNYLLSSVGVAVLLTRKITKIWELFCLALFPNDRRSRNFLSFKSNVVTSVAVLLEQDLKCLWY